MSRFLFFWFYLLVANVACSTFTFVIRCTAETTLSSNTANRRMLHVLN